MERLVFESQLGKQSILGRKEIRPVHQAFHCRYAEKWVNDDSSYLFLVRHHQHLHIWSWPSHSYSTWCAYTHRLRYFNCRWWQVLQQKTRVQSKLSQHRRLDRIHLGISKNRISWPKGTCHIPEYVVGQVYFLWPIGRANLRLPCSSWITSQRRQILPWPIPPRFHLSSPSPSSSEALALWTHQQPRRPMVVYQHVAERRTPWD